MGAVKARITVAADGTVSLSGVTLPPGEYTATLVEADGAAEALKLPVLDWPWPEDLPLRREDMYGDDGR
ncbi:MAG TPA: hypothetical protein VEH84_06220 [Alphaproteobacteria bacterium]|nr:hypothetical protein [Alphaproteobacteria bacterium]